LVAIGAVFRWYARAMYRDHSGLVVSTSDCSARGPMIKLALQTVLCFSWKPLRYIALGMACTLTAVSTYSDCSVENFAIQHHSDLRGAFFMLEWWYP